MTGFIWMLTSITTSMKIHEYIWLNIIRSKMLYDMYLQFHRSNHSSWYIQGSSTLSYKFLELACSPRPHKGRYLFRVQISMTMQRRLWSLPYTFSHDWSQGSNSRPLDPESHAQTSRPLQSCPQQYYYKNAWLVVLIISYCCFSTFISTSC